MITVDTIPPAHHIADVTNTDELNRKLGNEEFDAVIHLTAITNIEATINDPYQCYKVNCFGTLNMLEVARRKEVERLIYASSANVYGLPPELPVTEKTPFNPRSPYDFSKVISEHFVESYHVHHGVPTVTLRSWKLFGKYDVPTTAIPTFIRACLENRPIPLYNGGQDTTDPYYVENYCYAVKLCLTKQEAVGEAFNVGTGRQVSIRQMAEIIKELTNSSSELQILPPRTELEATPMKSYPSIEKIKRALGYEPVVDLEEGLRRTIEYYKSEN